MNRKTQGLLLISIVLACSTVWAQDVEGDKVLLQYKPQVGERVECIASSAMKDVQMNGVSLGLFGKASGTLSMEVVAVDDERGQFTLQASFCDLSADFQGQEREPAPIAPLLLTLTSTGSLQEVAREPQAGGGDGLSAFTSGGLPLDVVSLLGATVQFPTTPLAVGDSWELEDTRELPVVGSATLVTTNRLVKIDGNVAFIETSIASELPGFEMDSPMMAGAKMKVQSARVVSEKIAREYDMSRSLVTRAKGDLLIEMNADLGFGQTKFALMGDVDLRPADEPEAEEEIETAPEKVETAGAAAAGAELRSVRLGALAASGAYNQGTARVGLGVDLAKSRLAARQDKYGLLAKTTRIGGSIDAGVAGERAGTVTLEGEFAVGPLYRQGQVSVDLRTVAARALELARQITATR